jgi:predicted nucleotidyltransferase
MTDFAGLLRVLNENRVEFILIGGVAAAVHGAIRTTRDLDVVYARTPENFSRLARALAPLNAYLRGAPPGLPFHWDAETIAHGLNFTLDTSLGQIDVVGEIVGGGSYDELEPHCLKVSAFGTEFLCLDLDTLIRVKRAAGRPKDFEAIAELDALREEKSNQ